MTVTKLGVGNIQSMWTHTWVLTGPGSNKMLEAGYQVLLARLVVYESDEDKDLKMESRSGGHFQQIKLNISL